MIHKYNITILCCGGTIAQKKDQHGHLRISYDNNEFHNICMSYLSKFTDKVEFQFITTAVLDSANARAVHWQHIIDTIYSVQTQTDAIIILFGTDTLSYLANCIQLIAPYYLCKPVIITGSQLPLYEPGSDGLKNLVDSVKGVIELINQNTKGNHFIGCLVAFGEKYINASTVSKISARQIRGFDAPLVHQTCEGLKYKPGVIGHSDASGIIIDTTLYPESMLLSHDKYKIHCLNNLNNKKQNLPLNKFITWAPNNLLDPTQGFIGMTIMTIDFNPDSNPYSFMTIVQDLTISIVFICGVGDGNIGKHWLTFITELNKIGIAVFIHSPFFDGKAGVSLYGTAADAEKAGAIPTFGMTKSMLFVKSKWLLATKQATNIENFTKKFLTNYVDEVLLTEQQLHRIWNRIDQLAQLRQADRIQNNLVKIQQAQEIWERHLKDITATKELGFVS